VSSSAAHLARDRLRSRIEGRVFYAAAAIVALHASVDTQVAPQQGTSFTDNVGPFFGPLVALGIAVLVYRRARPGLRAALAGLLGVLSAEAAFLAIADAGRAFARPSDITGFLLAPVAVALFTDAVFLLWRSRKPGRLRYVRRVGLTLATALACLWIAVPLALAVYATHRPRADVPTSGLGAPYERVTVRTRDGLRLAAWYVRPRNGAVVISFPTRVGKLAQARMLIRHGYGVLILDMRGYEESDGNPNAFGWGATKDIDAGVTWLARRREVRAVGGIGFSVGGEQMLEAAAENPSLRAVVSEGAGERSIRETLLHGWRAALAVPIAATQTTALAVMSQTLPPPSLADVAGNIAPRAVFFIYAEHGAGGEELNPLLYRRAGEPKVIWEVPGAHHVGGLQAQPTAYERRVIGFFDRHLRPATRSIATTSLP
jgi:dienelactone hydrolase